MISMPRPVFYCELLHLIHCGLVAIGANTHPRVACPAALLVIAVIMLHMDVHHATSVRFGSPSTTVVE
jgi:hypothetical protein